MTAQEALALLDASIADEKPSRFNSNLTRAVAVDLIREAVKSGAFGSNVHPRTRALIESHVRCISEDGKTPPTAAVVWEEGYAQGIEDCGGDRENSARTNPYQHG